MLDMGFEPQIRKIIEQIRVSMVVAYVPYYVNPWYCLLELCTSSCNCSLIGRPSCGVQHGLVKCRHLLENSWMIIFKWTLVRPNWLPIMIFCKSLMSALRVRRKPSECQHFAYTWCTSEWGIFLKTWSCITRIIKLMEEILGERGNNKTIIFTETKRRADDLTRWMRRNGYVTVDFCYRKVSLYSCCLGRLIIASYYRWPAMVIHGDKSQQERDWVLSGT